MNSPAVNELKLEGSVYALFAEFLSGLFDGGEHAVGANAAVSFPKLYGAKLNNIRFGQSAVPQPLDGASITLVLSAGHTNRLWENATVPAARFDSGTYRSSGQYGSGPTMQQMAYTRVRLNFWVRAETAEPRLGGGNARELCLHTCDLLNGVLNNAAAVRGLAQKGVKRIRAGVPQPVSETTHVLRLLPVTATLRYPLLSQI